MSAHLVHGDCMAVLAKLPENLVDSVVTDPPYHLTSTVKRFGKDGSAPAQFGTDGRFKRLSVGFMGKQWDGGNIAMSPETWAAVLRVMKPGAHLVAFGGTRTHHRIWCAIEDAGFEVRDTIMWVYGSGFPKSHDAGDGWGTALKPAFEPIILARKPLSEKTVAANMARWGTGAINVDGCRVPVDPEADASQIRTMQRGQRTEDTSGQVWGLSKNGADAPQVVHLEGRWPANLIHDGSEEVIAAFPQAPGQQRYVGPENGPKDSVNCYGDFAARPPTPPRGDSGSAARFFYCAKASKADRNEGCDDLPDRLGGVRSETSGQHITRRDGGDPGMVKNNHPTVKPTDLMRYLCRLVTPANGLVLDPFMGSGSTGKAALLEHFRFLGIEKEAEYMSIAQARVSGASVHRSVA